MAKGRTAAHNIQHYAKTQAKKDRDGTVHSTPCEVLVMVNDGDDRSGFTIYKARDSVTELRE